MFRQLLKFTESDSFRVFGAVLMISVGLKSLKDVSENRAGYLAELDLAIVDRRADLAALDERVVAVRAEQLAKVKEAGASYPTPKDLDPLGNGE